MQGPCKNASLHAKRNGKPLRECKERSTRVNLNFKKTTFTVVKTRFGKGYNGSMKTG